MFRKNDFIVYIKRRFQAGENWAFRNLIEAVVNYGVDNFPDEEQLSGYLKEVLEKSIGLTSPEISSFFRVPSIRESSLNLEDFAEIVEKSIPTDILLDWEPGEVNDMIDVEIMLYDNSLHEVYKDGRVRVIFKKYSDADYYELYQYSYFPDGCWAAEFDFGNLTALMSNFNNSIENVIKEFTVGEKGYFSDRGCSVVV